MSLIYKNLPYINPCKIFDEVAKYYATIFLDSKLQHNYYGRYSFIGIDPVFTIIPETKSLLQEQLQNFEELNLVEVQEGLPPFTGGLMGYLSYEYAQQLESSIVGNFNENSQVPDYWFGLYNQVFAFDNQKKECYLLVTELPGINSGQLLSKLNDIYDRACSSSEIKIEKPEAIKLHSNFTKDEYIKAVKQVVQYIKSGDVFEANLAQRFSANISDEYSSHTLYRYLQFKNPSPFAAYLNLDKLKILSASPERFIKIIGNEVEVRPIKGTIRRDNDLQIDNLLAQTLQSSSKDRAENIGDCGFDA